MSTEVLHGTWLPATKRFFLWGESADLMSRKGRQPKIAPHPFGSPPAQLREYLERHSLPAPPATDLEEQARTIWLPSTGKSPVPSPELLSGGAIIRPEGEVGLRAWQVTGLAYPPGPAVDLLLALGSVGSVGSLGSVSGLGADLRAWHLAALLAMEVVAAQEMMPALARDGAQRRYQLRALWRLRVTPERAQKMAALAHALPSLARAITDDPAQAHSPRALLDDFVGTVADTTIRELRFTSHLSPTTPGGKWLAALLGDDPAVPLKGSEADELFKAWQRWSGQGFLAGDEAFRVTFRLEPPGLERPETQGDNGHNHKQAWSLSYLLQATDDPSLLVPASSVWREKGRAATFLKRHFEQPQERLLAALGYAARLFLPIEASLKEATPAGARFGPVEAFSFLKEAVPLLEQSGFGVLVPSWWTGKGARLQARARARMSGGSKANEQSRLSLDTLVSFDWEITLGDEPVDHVEFERLVALKMPLVQVRGQWVVLDPEHLQEALAFFDRHGGHKQQMPLLAAMPLLLDPEAQAARQGVPQHLELGGVVAEGRLRDLLTELRDNQQLRPLPEPEGLCGKLRPYQQRGYSWLAFLRRTGFGACLADDMGLGKSIQAITLLLHEREHLAATAPALLVCPTSVVGNWVRELERFAPSLRVAVHHGADRKQGDEFVRQLQVEGQNVDVVLTSYPLLARDRETLAAVPWGTVVLDEAQNIKNASTKQAQAARSLKPANRVALTGTPVENRLSELWSIMTFLNPGYLGSEAAFRREYARPIERTGDQEARERLRKLTTPFVLRRLKTDKSIISDLPEKMEMKVYCSLTREQATLYQAVVQDYLEKIEASEAEGLEALARRGQVLAMLMRLKQICNHPVQYLQDGSALPGRSGKLARLVEMLEEVYANDDRALIFTQFASFGAQLQTYLGTIFYDDVLFLHGGTPAKERDPMVRRFQAPDGPRIFILSLKAGGTGLNLTSANHVFHYDRWWNPAVENQATDRAFRIGQTRNVQVHKFICGGTLEDHIDEMIESKRELAESVIGEGESWLTELSTDQLRDLVMLRQADVEEGE